MTTDDPTELPPIEFVDRPTAGRVFTSTRRIRWGDTDPTGRLRLDAAARYLQDNSNDDTRDAGLDPTEPWVVRRTAFRIGTAPTVGRIATLATWNSGQGRRWAERRTAIETDDGGRIEAASLWVRIDRETGVPARLDAGFHAVYDEAAGGRRIGSRLRLPAPTDLPSPAPPSEPLSPASGSPELSSRSWALRHTDLDGLGHVNNAATWEPIVDEMARHRIDARYAELEYGDGIGPDDRVELVSRLDSGPATDAAGPGPRPDASVRETGRRLLVWLLVDGAVRATALVTGC